ncbi:hypothetical protein AB0M68_03870 [Streptomyces sp. NPDC051453]|uniref:hypothetical protein n=1 Tax=Streptomyces sp. NPDC051453 TaxID=3154941 RepID=UPI00341A7B4F
MTAIAPKSAPLEAALDAGFLIVPGLRDWLGSDYQQSIDDGFTETFEDFCTRISRKEAS